MVFNAMRLDEITKEYRRSSKIEPWDISIYIEIKEITMN